MRSERENNNIIFTSRVVDEKTTARDESDEELKITLDDKTVYVELFVP